MIHTPDAESRRGKQIPVDLTQPLALTVHNPNGDVSVRAVDRSDVLIGYVSPADVEDLGDDEAGLTIEARDNRIEVRPNRRVDIGWAGIAGEIDLESLVGQISKTFRFGGPPFATKPGRARIGSGGRVWPDIAVEVPRQIAGRVEIHSASGDVRVEDFTGEIALNTMSGDLRAVRTRGSLVLQAASGDLIVENVSGRLTARAASGDVRVAAAQIDGFEIQTASGDIFVDAMLAGDGPFHARTASGDVRLTLRRPAAEGEEPAATLAFHTVSGDARVDAPFRRIDRRRWQSGTGQPGPHIDITTVNGDLYIDVTAAASAFVPAPEPLIPPADEPPAPAAPSGWPHSERELAGADVGPEAMRPTAPENADRLAVLEAVERGEIDVEEALRRLEVADTTANP